MIKEAIVKVSEGKDLTFDEAYEVVSEIMGGETDQAQTAAFLTALHIKGETPDEISGAATAMREKALPVEHESKVLEIVGTGGDKAQSMNVSTTTAFLLAAAGVNIAKHGNRAATSKCGTADALEALGGNLMVSPELNQKMIEENGFAFMFAQKYHSAMKYVGPVRKTIGIPTIYKEELVDEIAETLKKMGVKRAMVVFGQDELDEISVSAKTSVAELKEDGSIERYEINPADFGITEKYTRDDIKGGEPKENALLTKEILSGKAGMEGSKANLAMKNVVLLNAAAALHLVKGVSLKEGFKEAEEVMNSGKALNVIDRYVKMSNLEAQA